MIRRVKFRLKLKKTRPFQAQKNANWQNNTDSLGFFATLSMSEI